MLARLASRGWVCISANYRLRPAGFPAPLVDVKRVIAWVRDHGASTAPIRRSSSSQAALRARTSQQPRR